MKIKYRYFWKYFDKTNNIFKIILSQEFRERDKLTIEIHSVFTRPRRFYSYFIRAQIFLRLKIRRLFGLRVIYIWYTGELISPPKGYDLTLSYEPSNRNNIYWPLWATYTDYSNKGIQLDRGKTFSMTELVEHRDLINLGERSWKSCAFISNPTDWRLKIAKELEEMGILDIYGKSVGRPVTSKYEISKDYMFQFCFENKVSERYISEKPFEAWISGNIPIYLGGFNNEYLNNSSLIDCRSVNFDEITKFIANSITNEKLMLDKWCQPILLKPYRYQHFLDNLNNRILDIDH